MKNHFSKKLSLYLLVVAFACFLFASARVYITAATIFNDNFEDGNSTGWTTSGGSWSVVSDGSMVYKQTSTSATTHAYTGTSTWTNYSVEARVKPLAFNGTDRPFGICARFQSASNYYYLTLSNANILALRKKVSGGITTLTSKTFTVQTGTWYTLKLTVNGNTLQAYVNNNLELTASDSTFTSGRIGLTTLNVSAEFDDVLVADSGLTTNTPSPTRAVNSTPTPTQRVNLTTTPTPITGVTATPTPTQSVIITPPPPGGPVGFATVNALGQNGTTGGASGPSVTVTTTAQFLDYISRPEPYIIYVSGTITLTGMHDVTSDKSIIGLGPNAGFTGGGLNIGLPIDDAITAPPANAVHNVIIRNLTFSVSSDDLINVQMFSHHVWIDHCDFSNASDGAVDIKRGSDYCTVSWNKFHNHSKTCLLGHDDSNGPQDSGRLHVTYHHNWFNATTQRHPRVRFGVCHVYNNYYNDLGDYGIGIGVQAQIYSENNYFENVEDCSQFYGTGWLKDVGSYQYNCETFVSDPSGVTWIPGNFYSNTPDPATSVKSIVMAGAGVGKI